MKKILLLLLIIGHSAFAQTPKPIKSRVDKVIVFNRGAQLFATEKVALPAGTTDLVFENVSPQLLEASLQAGAGGGAVVMDVRYHLQYAIVEKKPSDPALKKFEKDLKGVLDSLTDIGFTMKGLQNQINNLATERNVLLNNRLMKGELQRDSLIIFQQSIEFLRQRLDNINTAMLKLEREQYRWSELRDGLQQRQATLQTLISGNYAPPTADAQPVSQVIVTVLSERAMNTDVTINYFVENAGWTPSYDLRADNNSTDIELNHRAGVYQNSGIEWKDVLLTLSTGNPNESSVKPVLSPYLLNYTQYVAMERKKMKETLASKPQAAAMTDDVKDYEEYSGPEIDGVYDYTTVSQNALRVVYEISLKYTIASDGQAHNVVIQNRKIPAQYNYTVVPKLDPDVFLMARLTDWEDLNLVPGTARVYFEGTYVGQTAINPGSTNDTLLLNLGRDKSIVVKRIKLKDKSREKILNENKMVTKTYEISVRNTKAIPIRLIVEDQMPISADPSIKITYEEYGKASFNPDTGKLVWDFKLDPKENKKVSFTYEVKYPKDRALAGI
ncbi:MAG TPA: DUF4139 domain-containing protein [Saprospiraceae bacterium]|nr:DUF4139 domain-containing protein [Saprospiraceae bacterium]HPI06826.1 DUF4139 domain-containing protein [Saprospiraceae bacterium]